MDATGNILQVVIALAAVIGLVLLCAFAARRLMGGTVQGGSGNQIRVIAVRALGTRERLVLVEVGGEVTLLGVTQNQITSLREVPASVAEGAPAMPRFSDTLGRLMGRQQ